MRCGMRDGRTEYRKSRVNETPTQMAGLDHFLSAGYMAALGRKTSDQRRIPIPGKRLPEMKRTLNPAT